jgi:hypothetical protein
MTIKGGLADGGGLEGVGEGTGGVNMIEIHCMYEDSIMKPTTCCMKMEAGGRRQRG